MLQLTYASCALLTAMCSHRVDSPDITSNVRTGRPNTCNLCHLDRTLQWSAEHLTKYYGAPDVEQNKEQKQITASLHWLLKGNSAQRVIIAWNMGWEPALEVSGKHWQAPFLAQLLDDPYPTLCFVTQRSLLHLLGFASFEYDFCPHTERCAAQQPAGNVWRQTPWPTADINLGALPIDANHNL